MRNSGVMSGTRSQTAVVAALALACSLAQAQEPGSANWRCQRCPSASGWDLDIDGGLAYLADDAFRFGDYAGLDEKGWYLFGDVFGRYRGEDAGYLVFEGYTRSRDSSALFVRGGKQSAYEIRGSYQSIPRRFFDSTATPFGGIGSAVLTLPAGWVRAPITQQMTSLQSSLAPVAIGRDWDIYGLGLDWKAAERWQFIMDYTRREREGVARSSGSFFFSASELLAPIDYTTDDLEVTVRFAADTWQASMIYFGSVFRNGNESLTWDNPYTSPSGADTGRLALPPDNESHQVSLAGSMLLPARTTLNGQVSIGRLTQNTALLAYTTNTTLPTNPLPVSSANGKVDTLNLNLRAVSSPWRNASFEGELRYNVFENKTPVNSYEYVVTDTALAAGPARSSAYDYERREIKLRIDYRLLRGMRLYLGIDNERFDRSRQDRRRTDTNRFWITFRTQFGQRADASVDGFLESRDGSTYETVINPLAPENPLMRKYNMADRDRNGLRLHGTIFGGERSDFGWELEISEDSYDNSALGLTTSKYTRVGADFSYLFSETSSAYASVYQEQIDTDQRNSQSFSLPDWSATSEDRFTTATLGIAWSELFTLLDANLEYSYSHSVGEIRNNTSGLQSSFPDLISKRQNLKIGLSYPFSERLRIDFDYYFEKLDSDDWALDGVFPDTVLNLLALGAEAWNYDANVIYFGVRYASK